MNKTYFTYILYSEKSAKFYIGSTENLERRIQEHNSGETKSIRRGIPWKVITCFRFDNRKDAVQLENKIKKRGAKRFLDDIKKNSGV